MTPRTLANLLAVREMLKSGRASSALEMLEVVLREIGAMPTTRGPDPVPPTQRPVWMRTGA